jgi:acyl-coenzyme A synthetase/AMP-(fatty) acid ligase
MTEASPLITQSIIGSTNYDSAGVPIPNTEMKIVDAETRTDLAQGEMGEICVRGPQVRSESHGSVCIMKIFLIDAFRFSVIDPVAIIGLYCKSDIYLRDIYIYIYIYMYRVITIWRHRGK